MNRPDFLQKDDIVAIVSPSGPIQENALDYAIGVLQSWGLRVKIGKNVYARNGVFAGTDEQRIADLQTMIDDDSVRAIICARGGYGAIRIVDSVDYSRLISHPKWLVGFSDITVFHEKLNSLGLVSVHGVMAKGFSSVTSESLESLQQILFGLPRQIVAKNDFGNRQGICSGELVGGNLSILYSLRGTPFEYDYEGKILFIEDLNEYLYHIDRMLQNFKQSGIFSKIVGLIVGTMSGMKNGTDQYNGTVESIILDAVKDYDFPVAFNFPSGHENLNQALMVGEQYTLTVEEKSATLCWNDLA